MADDQKEEETVDQFAILRQMVRDVALDKTLSSRERSMQVQRLMMQRWHQSQTSKCADHDFAESDGNGGRGNPESSASASVVEQPSHDHSQCRHNHESSVIEDGDGDGREISHNSAVRVPGTYDNIRRHYTVWLLFPSTYANTIAFTISTSIIIPITITIYHPHPHPHPHHRFST